MMQAISMRYPFYILLESQWHIYTGSLFEMVAEEFDGSVSDDEQKDKAGRWKKILIAKAPCRPEI